MKSNYNQIAHELVSYFDKMQIRAYFWYESKWGSCYIRFHFDIETIMVGHGIGNEEYEYTYYLRGDIKRHYKELDGIKWRYHYPLHLIEMLKTQICKDYIDTLKLKQKIKHAK